MTGAAIEIFGRGGAQKTAAALGAPFLGEIPIDPLLRAACDEGRPYVIVAPASPASLAIVAMASVVAEALTAGEGAKPAPRIVIEG